MRVFREKVPGGYSAVFQKSRGDLSVLASIENSVGKEERKK